MIQQEVYRLIHQVHGTSRYLKMSQQEKLKLLAFRALLRLDNKFFGYTMVQILLL
jgi:hypothetical protein